MEVGDSSAAKPTYQGEFNKGVDLFDKEFQAYQKSTFDAQKREYSKSMHDALDVIGDSAKGMANTKLQEMKAKLEKDLDEYIKNPTEINRQHVDEDLNTLKN